MKKETAEKILLDTEKGYDLISEKFSQTRKGLWEDLEFIENYIKDSQKVLDFGCGNGRLYSFLREKVNIQYSGVDVSEKLIVKARDLNPEANFEKINPSQTSLALEDSFFNTVFSIAVFHHIPSRKKRERLARELFRTTKPGGRVVVTVWNFWQKNYRKNIFQNWKNKISSSIICMSGIRSAGSQHDNVVNNLDWNDCYISFTNNQGDVFQRYHHAFTKRELKKLFEKAGFKTEKCYVSNGRNIIYIGKKLQ